MKKSFVVVVACMIFTGDRAAADPESEARVASAIEAIGVFVDFDQFESICQLYDDTATSDYSSLWGNEPLVGTPSETATGWSGFIPGFDTTRHAIAVERVSVEEDVAEARARTLIDRPVVCPTD